MFDLLDHGLTKGIHDKRREKEKVDRNRRRESPDRRDAPAPFFGAHRVDQRAHKHVIFFSLRDRSLYRDRFMLILSAP